MTTLASADLASDILDLIDQAFLPAPVVLATLLDLADFYRQRVDNEATDGALQERSGDEKAPVFRPGGEPGPATD